MLAATLNAQVNALTTATAAATAPHGLPTHVEKEKLPKYDGIQGYYQISSSGCASTVP